MKKSMCCFRDVGSGIKAEGRTRLREHEPRQTNIEAHDPRQKKFFRDKGSPLRFQLCGTRGMLGMTSRVVPDLRQSNMEAQDPRQKGKN